MAKKALALILLTLAVAPPASAYDATWTPMAERLSAIAYRYWERGPHCKTYHLYVEPITDQPPTVDGTSQPAAAEAEQPGCMMRIIPEVWMDDRNGDGWSEADLCIIYLHEYGHNLGFGHSTNPLSVMNPLTLYYTGRPKVCAEIEAAHPVITHTIWH